MKWSDEYSTGVEKLDHQHRMLFQMIGDLRAALDEGRGEKVYDLFLESLERYARAHFGLEEECMTLYACPAAEANAAAHAGFTKALAEHADRYRANGFDRVEATALVQMLERWLLDHIARVDTRLKPYAEEAPAPSG